MKKLIPIIEKQQCIEEIFMSSRRFCIQSLYGLALLLASGHALAGNAENIVRIINSEYGAVCKADLTGVFSKTLKIDWT